MEVSEWVAVVSVVVAMLTLAVQQHLTRRQSQTEARDRHHDRTQVLLLRAMDDPELLDAISDGSGADQKLRRYCQLWINHIEIIFRNRHLFGREHWNGTLYDIRDFMIMTPLLEYWQQNGRFYAADFRKFMDHEVRELGVEAPLCEAPPTLSQGDQASTT